MERLWHADGPLDLRRTLAPLRHGPRDPTYTVGPAGALWRGTLTPDGPATARLTQQGSEIACAAWGPGAQWVVEQLPEMCGADLSEVSFGQAQLDAAHRGSAGLRIPRTARVMESLVPAILEQKVTGKEAFAAYATLVRRYGEPAPGPVPADLFVPPDAAGWGRIPSWDWHTAGVDPRRMRTILAATKVASRLEEAVGMSCEEAKTRLRVVPGVGEWTAAEVAARAFGDTDAVSVGDFHLPQTVGWALVGKPVDDAGMLELLEPWRPHRALAIRLIEELGTAKPRFGPRLTVQDHRRH